MTGELPFPISAGPAALAELVTVTIGGPDAAWHYRIAVDGRAAMPPEPIATPKDDEPVSLGVFTRDDGVTVEVMGATLTREIDAADWLDGSALTADLVRGSSRRTRSPSGAGGDVLFRNTTHAIRIFAARSGNRLFVIRCAAPKDVYPAVAEAFAGTIASFEPVAASGRFCEPVGKHGAASPVAWRCIVPVSWRVDPGGANEQAASFQAVNLRDRVEDDGEVVGRLVVAVFSREAIEKPREAADEYLDALAEAGLRVISDEFVPEDAEEPFDRSWLLTSAVSRDESLPGEVRCRVLRHPAAWALAAVLSPRAEDDRAAWMENKRALDIATATLTVGG